MQNKMIKLSVLTLSLLLASCGGGGSSSGNDAFNPVDEIGGSSTTPAGDNTNPINAGDESKSDTDTSPNSGNDTNNGNSDTSNGNEETTTAPTVNDTTPPTITIVGENPITITQGETYEDAGATATDDVDVSVDVVATGSVDTDTIGDYSNRLLPKPSN